MVEPPKKTPETALKRFEVELLIVHPTLAPEDISVALGLEAQHFHRVGDRRKIFKGTHLEGVYRDTRWRHSVLHETEEQWFAAKLAVFIDNLLPHKAFFGDIRASGGSACVIVQFLDSDYFGDEITRDTMAKLVALELDLGIELF